LLKKEDNLRTLRSLLRETIKHSRQDFDMNKFTFELLEDIRKRYQDFMNIDQYLRETFVVSICDLITVCIFVSITQQAKDAYLKRHTMNQKRFYCVIIKQCRVYSRKQLHGFKRLSDIMTLLTRKELIVYLKFFL
jgi:hypothetical protein